MTAPSSRDAARASNLDAGMVVPPLDVQQMLACHQATLAYYFDAQRWLATQRSREDWPCVWRMAPVEP